MFRLAVATVLILAVDARLSSSKKHFDMAAAQKAMGSANFAALKKDAKCNVKNAKQPSYTTSRCVELCQGRQQCTDVCTEVRDMICDPPVVVGVTSGDNAAAASAAAAAATSAVRDAVKDA